MLKISTCLRLFSVHLALVGLALAQDDPKPKPAETSFLVAESEALAPLADQDLTREFLAAAKAAPSYTERMLYRKARSRDWLAPAEYEKLPDDDKTGWSATPVNEMMYQGLFYGTPTAYVLPLHQLAIAGGPKSLKGLKIADFGNGGIGQLHIFARQGAHSVGIDVDPLQAKLYSEKADQGPQGDAGGTAKLITGRFPSDPKVVEALGAGYDIFLSKNTLKKGYVHPEVEVDPRMLLQLGVTDEEYVTAVAKLLKPGGWFLIYNIAPARNPPEKPYLPMADGRSPFSKEVLSAAGLKVVEFDKDDSDSVRKFGKLIGWDKPPSSMKLETDLFATFTLCQKK